MEHKNLVSLTNSNVLSSASGSWLAEQWSKTDAAFLIGRIVSVYGERKGVNMEGVVHEWHDALKTYRLEDVENAWKRHRNTSKFWPTIAEIIEGCKRYDIRTTEEKYGARHRYEPQARKDFARDGRTQAQEIVKRAADCLRWRQEAGLGQYVDPIERRAPSKPASDGGLSPAMIAVAKKGGYYKPQQQDEPV